MSLLYHVEKIIQTVRRCGIGWRAVSADHGDDKVTLRVDGRRHFDGDCLRDFGLAERPEHDLERHRFAALDFRLVKVGADNVRGLARKRGVDFYVDLFHGGAAERGIEHGQERHETVHVQDASPPG